MKSKNNTQTAAIFAALLGNMLWGLTGMLTRIAQRYATPLHLLSLRFLIAVPLLVIFLAIRGVRLDFRGKRFLPLLSLCIVEPVTFFFESYGIYYTNSTYAGIAQALSTVAAIVLGMIFLKEFPKKKQAAFCALPMLGVIFITTAGQKLGVLNPIGLACLFLFCVTSGGYKVANKGASAFGPYERTLALLISCLLVFTAAALIERGGEVRGYFEPLQHSEFVWAVLALCVLASIAANTLANYASGRISVAKMSAFASTQALVSTFAGVVLLHEPINLSALVGIVLIVVGVFLVNRSGQ